MALPILAIVRITHIDISILVEAFILEIVLRRVTITRDILVAFGLKHRPFDILKQGTAAEFVGFIMKNLPFFRSNRFSLILYSSWNP